jgi:hypothetical protein
MESPFRIEAITLRGIGPYYDAARLELRPITVLCGKNGSGKSTWFKALDLIRRSSKLPDFPFVWDMPESLWVSDIDTINARLYLEGDPERLGDAADSVPPGTIGLDLVAVADLALRVPHDARREVNPVESMLWSGLIQRGTRISLRLTQPHIDTRWHATRLHDEVRLIVNGQHQLWFHRPLGQKGEYRFESSGSFTRGGSIDDLTLSPVSSLDPRGRPAEPSDQDWNGKACRNAVGLIRQVTAAATAGVFYLAAIRPLQQVQDVASFRFDESDETRRRRTDAERMALETCNVAEDGSCAYPLFRASLTTAWFERSHRGASHNSPRQPGRVMTTPSGTYSRGSFRNGWTNSCRCGSAKRLGREARNRGFSMPSTKTPVRSRWATWRAARRVQLTPCFRNPASLTRTFRLSQARWPSLSTGISDGRNNRPPASAPVSIRCSRSSCNSASCGGTKRSSWRTPKCIFTPRFRSNSRSS